MSNHSKSRSIVAFVISGSVHVAFAVSLLAIPTVMEDKYEIVDMTVHQAQRKPEPEPEPEPEEEEPVKIAPPPAKPKKRYNRPKFLYNPETHEFFLDQGGNAHTGPGRQLLHDPRVIDLYLGTLGKVE